MELARECPREAAPVCEAAAVESELDQEWQHEEVPVCEAAAAKDPVLDVIPTDAHGCKEHEMLVQVLERGSSHIFATPVAEEQEVGRALRAVPPEAHGVRSVGWKTPSP